MLIKQNLLGQNTAVIDTPQPTKLINTSMCASALTYVHVHTAMFLSTEPDTSTGYWLLMQIVVTKCVCASAMVRIHRPS